MYYTDEQQRYRQCLMPDLDSSTLSELQAILHKGNPYSRDEYQYTTPTASKVAVLMVESSQESECLNYDIILYKQGGSLQRISQIHPAYNTPLESFALHRAGQLFQQYIVDAYACIEQSQLNYLRLNQKQIWAELYNGLQDTLT
ncbi:12727_t:CDS:2, partial [Acaulospora morrowiae]